MTIAVLFLTRARPAGLVAAVHAFHATASGDVPVSYVICCDDDDTSLETSLPLLEGLPVTISRNPRPDALGRAWNRGAIAAGAWDIAVFTGDDTVPAAPAWDLRMASMVPARLPALAWREASDPLNVTYWAISRRWHDAAGQACPEIFPFWFNDTWAAEVHLLAFGRPMHQDSALVMAGRRGTTREMRELAFWFRVFAATRPQRVAEARRIARAFGSPPLDPAPLLAHFAAWDAEQQSRVPAMNAGFGADQVPPTPRYLRLRARAERLLDTPAFDFDAAAQRARDPLPHRPFMAPTP